MFYYTVCNATIFCEIICKILQHVFQVVCKPCNIILYIHSMQIIKEPKNINSDSQLSTSVVQIQKEVKLITGSYGYCSSQISQ